METRESLDNYFQSIQTHEAFIEKYEANADYFNNLLESNNLSDVEFALNIKLLYYINKLYHHGQYNKALKIICQTEKEVHKLKGVSKAYNIFNNTLTFNKGICLGRLKKYRASNIEIKKVLANDPTNDIYIGWIEGNNTSIFRQYNNALAIIGAIIILTIIVFDSNKEIVQNTILRESGWILMLLSLILYYLAPRIIKIRRK